VSGDSNTSAASYDHSGHPDGSLRSAPSSRCSSLAPATSQFSPPTAATLSPASGKGGLNGDPVARLWRKFGDGREDVNEKLQRYAEQQPRFDKWNDQAAIEALESVTLDNTERESSWRIDA
jgi:hypothetical protein